MFFRAQLCNVVEQCSNTKHKFALATCRFNFAWGFTSYGCHFLCINWNTIPCRVKMGKNCQVVGCKSISDRLTSYGLVQWAVSCDWTNWVFEAKKWTQLSCCFFLWSVDEIRVDHWAIALSLLFTQGSRLYT